jgi:hypothetical protein
VLTYLEILLQFFAPDNFLFQLPVRGGHYLQTGPGGLRDFARGDVHHGGTTFLPVEQALGFDVNEPERLVFASKLKITSLFDPARKNLFKKGAEGRTKLGGNQPPKRLAQQTGTFDYDPREINYCDKNFLVFNPSLYQLCFGQRFGERESGAQPERNDRRRTAGGSTPIFRCHSMPLVTSALFCGTEPAWSWGTGPTDRR